MAAAFSLSSGEEISPSVSEQALSFPHSPTTGPGLHPARMENLSDGVFSIVMTLLVLNLKLPDMASAPITNHMLWAKIVTQWPMFLGLVISFLSLGSLWIGYRAMYHHIRLTNRSLMWLSIVFLLCVSLVPYTTGLITHFPFQPLAVVLYGGNMLLCSISLFWIWHQVTTSCHLVHNNITDEIIRLGRHRVIVGAVCYALGVAMAFVVPWVSLVVYVAIALYYVFPGKIDQYWMSVE